MTDAVNADLRNLIRDLAMRRESHDRRQLYWALIKAEILTPVRVEAAPSSIQPADLHPLDCEALGGMASFGVFTHQAAAEQWQKEEGEGIPLRLERIGFVDFLPILLSAGAGSLYLNPGAKYSGELYRHELETCLDGARKLSRRNRQTQSNAGAEPQQEQPTPSIWARWFGWLR